MERQLTHEPAKETRQQKKLRLNRLAQWELRIDAFRVFYDVATDSEVVRVVAVGGESRR